MTTLTVFLIVQIAINFILARLAGQLANRVSFLEAETAGIQEELEGFYESEDDVPTDDANQVAE